MRPESALNLLMGLVWAAILAQGALQARQSAGVGLFAWVLAGFGLMVATLCFVGHLLRRQKATFWESLFYWVIAGAFAGIVVAGLGMCASAKSPASQAVSWSL